MPQKDHIPGFEAQGVSVTRIRNEDLFGVAGAVTYNGAICQWKGKTLMAYRRFDPHKRHPKEGNLMNIAISELDDKRMPTGKHYAPTMPYRLGYERYEDPRLFVHEGHLYLAVVEAKINAGLYSVNQKLFRLDDDLQIKHVVDIRVGNNFRGNGFSEKNWTYFSESGKLYLIYDIHQMQVHEINPKTGQVVWGNSLPRLHWPFGFMRGGTCPVQLPSGEWMKIVHSSTDTPWSPLGGRRRYSMSAVIFEEKPPFKFLRISKEPIVYGTRNEWWCGGGCSQCVFPAGTIIDGDIWHISAGVNDSYTAIFHLDGRKVMDGMVDASYFDKPKKRYFKSSNPKAITTIVGHDNNWRMTRVGGRGCEGILETDDPFSIAELIANEFAQELNKEEYEKLLSSVSGNPTQDDYAWMRTKPKKFILNEGLTK